ncbi:MAG: hypothetical protein J0L81_09685 [Caulobacterales bacterium]|jgi:hypothetical protein|nr:hypothetical protein [Caulobacterales bacterium]
MLFGQNMSPGGYAVRMVMCGLSDVFDFTVGRAMFLVPGEEVPAALFYSLMFGWRGIAHLGELVDITEQLDAFIPSALLVGAWAGYDKGVWGNKAGR